MLLDIGLHNRQVNHSAVVHADTPRAMALEELHTARMLLVDDDEDNLALLELSLRGAGAKHVVTVSNPLEAADVYREFSPDLAILDLRMPPVDGFYVMDQFRSIDGPERMVPIIMLTGDATAATKQKALEAGVADFLHKNFDMAELLLRVRNVLRMQQLYRQVQRQKMWLEETVRIRTRQLFAARREVLERLAMAAEFRDDQTGEHTRRVGQLSAQIAQHLDQDLGFVESIGAAALLHDIGKIGIPDSILLKRGPLTPEEYSIMKEHTLIGASILADCTEPVMRMAREIALTHHERWDGNGYPNGISSEEIPICGRIVSVADAFDAMITERPYKKPMAVEDAINEIVSKQAKQFDPKVVAAFLTVMKSGHPETHERISRLAATFVHQPQLRFDA